MLQLILEDFFMRTFALFCLYRPTAAPEGSEPSVDGADAQQTSDAGGHLQSVSALQRQGARGHRYSPACSGGAGSEELAESLR